jgi:hypothetical protein
MVGTAVPTTVLLSDPPVKTNWTSVMPAFEVALASRRAFPLKTAPFDGMTTDVTGGVLVTGRAVVALSTSVAPPEAPKPYPAARHRVADGHVVALRTPVPATFSMLCPLEMVPVSGLSGTAWPFDGSAASFPTARHCNVDEQLTALSMAARADMV